MLEIIQLHFECKDKLVLYKICFDNPWVYEPVRVSYCGCSSVFRDQTGTFKWTTAVKGLCTLFLGTKLSFVSAKRNPSNHLFEVLTGSRPSLANSVDDCLQKQPTWLVDMFGVDSTGRAYASRLFKVHNTCGRRPGPVSIVCNQKILTALSIRIFLNGNAIDSEDGLLYLLLKLGTRTPELNQLMQRDMLPKLAAA